jgi:hypothetical protein
LGAPAERRLTRPVERRATRVFVSGVIGAQEELLLRWLRQRPGFPGGEIGMLVVETVVWIRREGAGGKPIKEIARDLRLSLRWGLLHMLGHAPDLNDAFSSAPTRTPREQHGSGESLA